jgi:hypothetical protein
LPVRDEAPVLHVRGLLLWVRCMGFSIFAYSF